VGPIGLGQSARPTGRDMRNLRPVAPGPPHPPGCLEWGRVTWSSPSSSRRPIPSAGSG